jgi:dimethylaniline monooxygenase (N-oxide forming)
LDYNISILVNSQRLLLDKDLAMKVVVIGAGPAGLVLCKSLLEARSPDFEFDPIILEQENDIGGTFRYRSYEVKNSGTTPRTCSYPGICAT